MKLKNKSYSKYKGKVYDLSVENKNSYNVEGIPVHNSGAGSLVCYATGITQVDPVKHGLLFERFLSKKKAGLPDIDCLEANTLVPTTTGYKKIKNIKQGDFIINIFNEKERVLFTSQRVSCETDDLFEIFVKINDCYGCIIATGKHRFFTENSSIKNVYSLNVGDLIKSNHINCSIVEKRKLNNQKVELVDISIESTKSFNIIPFNVLEENGILKVEKNYGLQQDCLE